MMFTKDELNILSSAVTHFTEAGWCPTTRIPRNPTTVQAAYLLGALELAAPEAETDNAYTLAERLEHRNYNERTSRKLKRTVGKLKGKLKKQTNLINK